VKLLRFDYQGATHTGVLDAQGIAPIPAINARKNVNAPNDLLAIIQHSATPLLEDLEGVERIPFDAVAPRLPYDVPPKIWCIGLNYKSHAIDINAVQPDEPGSFMKPASCMFEPGGEITLPPAEISNEVDAEGELAVIIGREARFLETPEDAAAAIFGYTVTLDLTALDVLRKNPRYLTRAKSFDTFFSFGPVIVTRDEVADPDQLEVLTEHNGAIFSRDFVFNMHTRPYELVRFHSDYMTLRPGDLISTGCPKGARIQPGDRVGGRIEGVGAITASVHGARQPKTRLLR
jgi:2-keto-4-pentenoate hydratase/2-oxohepta-3-ene-1,7-dioic acid hydratase in catechol pathway